MLPKKTTSQEILLITKVFDDKQENEYLLKCPHCGTIRGADKEGSLQDLGGAQYQDNICNGWYEISPDAVTVNDIEEL